MLHKVWHKFCFKCAVCGRQLTLKTYEGFGGWPYCATHYPATSHTVVFHTPEKLRTKKDPSSMVHHKDSDKPVHGSY